METVMILHLSGPRVWPLLVAGVCVVARPRCGLGSRLLCSRSAGVAKEGGH
jgi:hypothetical protein